MGRRHRRQRTEDEDPRRDGGFFRAVQDLSFRVEAGTIVGLLGPNGAGKTTLLRLLSTALRPSTGTATINGIDIVAAPLAVRAQLGFLSGTTGLYGRLTPREMVTYYGALHGVPAQILEDRRQDLFALLGMTSFADMRNDQLSTGMKQKVSIVRALIHEPEFLIFDEPTTGLDVAAAETVLRIMLRCKAAGKSILYSTHHMHEVERLCDQVVVLHQGRLGFVGTVDAMRTHTGETALDRAFLHLVGISPSTGAQLP